MIVVDTSALLAIVLGEPDAETYAEALADEEVMVSAASLVEAQIVSAARGGEDAARDLRLLIEACRAVVVPVDALHAARAVTAWQRFGKGRHPAGLNFGDCFAYAAASVAGTALLFKGNDFSQTDIRSCLS